MAMKINCKKGNMKNMKNMEKITLMSNISVVVIIVSMCAVHTHIAIIPHVKVIALACAAFGNRAANHCGWTLVMTCHEHDVSVPILT